jgi:hypothetical protein
MFLGRARPSRGKLDLRRRVVQDVILPRHPPEPHAQRNQNECCERKLNGSPFFLR